ncbi:hypothetical protein BT93_G1833 [Corymbia citriodora subsp. variegata]|nr:hypothetical protein BT93_G1833 [Corymbia citriodora subsp. variegata]
MLRAFEMSSLLNTTMEEKKMKPTGVKDDDFESSSTGTDEEEHGVCVEPDQISHNSLLSSEKLPATKMVFYEQCVDQKPSLTPVGGSSLEKTSKTCYSSDHMSEDDRLESARAQMGLVREENQRLKSILSKIVKDYQSLQHQFFEVVQEEKKVEMAPSPNKLLLPHSQENNEEAELLSLTLGLSSSRLKTDGERKNILTTQSESAKNGNSDLKQELSLGSYNGKITSCDRESLKDTKEGEILKIWPPSKVLKTVRSDDEQVMEQTQSKRARVCVRVRCDAPTMEDGCHWRKYGQKIAKGNPCPRGYYRCTVSPSCPVKKQVQRCAEDMSVLITTYEGNHNHPLPISATAMAFATSAATSMVQSCSSTSSQQQQQQQPDLRPSASSGPASATSTGGLNGIDFPGDRNPKLPRLYFSNSSSISTCNSRPTITLDLTSSPDFSNRDGHRSSSCFPSLPKLPSTFLSFSSSSSSHLDTTTHKSSSGIGPSVLNHGVPPQHQLYQPQLGPVTNSQASRAQSLPDKLGIEATKATPLNLSFQSALAAAMTSFVGDGATGFLGDKGKEGGFGLNLKFGDDPATQLNHSDHPR